MSKKLEIPLTEAQKEMFLSNCKEFNVKPEVALNKIFEETRWDTWNNKEWLEKIKDKK